MMYLYNGGRGWELGRCRLVVEDEQILARPEEVQNGRFEEGVLTNVARKDFE